MDSADYFKVALSGAVGAIVGASITSVLSFWKDRIQFKNNKLKEESDLVRKLVSKLFGLHYVYIGNLYLVNQSFINSYYYSHLTSIVTDKDFNNQCREELKIFNAALERHKERNIELLRDYSEIVSEYAYIMKESKISDNYAKLILAKNLIEVNFDGIKDMSDAEKLRKEYLVRYQSEIVLPIQQISYTIVQTMEGEGLKKYS